MKLSKNFELKEFLASQTATRRGFTEQFNPPQQIIDNLQYLVTNLLQPIRDNFGPLHISSGYRCPRLNSAIGGSSTSDHLLGFAADIDLGDAKNLELLNWIRESKLPFDQLINEFPNKLGQPDWVHISLRPKNNRNQFLTIGAR